MKILGRQPALWIAALNALLTILGTVGLHWFTQENAGAFVAVVNLASAAAIAYTTRPVRPSAFTALISGLVALLVSYGIHLPDQFLATINVAVFPFLALITSGDVSPVTTAISQGSDSPDITPEAAAHEERVAAAQSAKAAAHK